MKKSLVLAMAMALGVTASAYAANPFSDVPAGHWAYDSISKLAAEGVIEGYGDATFGGDKLMTRYEMAQIVAKAMAKGANCDKLAAEFADELDNLGVRVANLEKKADNVKITGTIKAVYASYGGDTKYSDTTKPGGTVVRNHMGRIRSDITIKGTVNEDWSYTALLRQENYFTGNMENTGEEGVQFQRAYVNGKVGGVAVQAGRYNFCDFTGGNIYNNRVDGVQVAYGKDIKLTAGIAKANSNPATNFITGVDKTYGKADDMLYANVATKIGVVNANVGYYSFKDLDTANSGVDDKIWTVGAALNVAKDLKLSATYLKSDLDKVAGVSYDDDGYVIDLSYKGAKAATPGTWGVYARYYDQGNGTVIAHEMDGNYAAKGFKGYRFGAAYAVAKNIVASVDYYDLEDKDVAGEPSRRTLWSQVAFSF